MSDGARAIAPQVTLPDTEAILSGLKPFQRSSVDYVFHRMYGPNHTRRFLLADEVGLGKTMVAKGVIARVIQHLRQCVQRMDVIYICSNHDIARQNINRLNVTGKKDFALASRITLLPIHIGSNHLRNEWLNLVSFTPGTSFDLKSRLGVSQERVLLYHLLREPWRLNGAAPIHVLRGHTGADGFRRQVEAFLDWNSIDSNIAAQFVANVALQPSLRDGFQDLCRHYHRSDARVADDAEQARNRLVGELRAVLARTCLQSLQPDLIILDEFQRFKHLLRNDDSAEAQLAHDLFRYSDEHSEARVLLLSATPYKMYTMSQESADDDHYADFLDTARFLLDDPERSKQVEELVKDYRRQLYYLAERNGQTIDHIRSRLEDCLRAVMCRTERLAVTEDRSGMLREIPLSLRLESADVHAYVGLQKIARKLKHRDTVEYWKSAPYLLNFMENYQLKDDLKKRCTDVEIFGTVSSLDRTKGVFLPWDAVRAYKKVEPHNPRLRHLLQETLDSGAWQMLWIPPSLPYYALSEPFVENRFTKRLVFSTWHVVPKAVATLLSYEAERRMVTLHDREADNTPDARKAIRPLLNFSHSKDRLTGMPVLALLYPSFFLAERFDPLSSLTKRNRDIQPQVEDILSEYEKEIGDAIAPLVRASPTTGAEDESWYWAAPILLDVQHNPGLTKAWLLNESLPALWSSIDGSEQEAQGQTGDEEHEDAGWRLHIDRARELLENGAASLGRPPSDVARVVAQFAVAGPAIVALRALARVGGGAPMLHDPECRHLAGKIAWGFRTLFNSPDVISLIRGLNAAEPYWRHVLEYCSHGCLQAVLDEYAHVLRDSLGDAGADAAKTCADVANAIATALSLRVANPGADQILPDHATKSVRIENHRLRARFAMRFGDERSDDGRTVSRKDQVRQAFNSPFWPFVLVTTSIGQEGLDFHTYCHAVVHWNLPSNPVDMEQREGRVHRYKGHAVRRNVALRHGSSLQSDDQADPWASLFAAAEKVQSGATDNTGLTPYWIYAVPDGAVIERHVPSLPLSREADQLPALRNSLAVYRMVFGQPRQDDLVAYLLERFSREEVTQHMERFRIDLSPKTVDVSDSANWPSAMAASRRWAEQGTTRGKSFGNAADDEKLGTLAGEVAVDVEHRFRPSADATVNDGPPPIDEVDRNEVLATIRDVFQSGGARDRDEAIRQVASALGYRRTGPRIYEVISSDVQTAVRRGILENSRGELSLAYRTIEHYTLDHLVEMLMAAMGGNWWTRDDAIVAAARHLGFRRTGQNIQAAFKSAINAGIRRGLLDREGAEYIRRAK